jgi:hypothetical protein
MLQLDQSMHTTSQAQQVLSGVYVGGFAGCSAADARIHCSTLVTFSVNAPNRQLQ